MQVSIARSSHQLPTAAANSSVLTALRSVGTLDVLHEYACACLGRDALSGQRLRRLATQAGEKGGLVHQAILQNEIDGGNPILPSDLFALRIIPTTVGNRDFIYAAFYPGYLCRELRFKSEAVLAQFDLLQYLAAKYLVAGTL